MPYASGAIFSAVARASSSVPTYMHERRRVQVVGFAPNLSESALPVAWRNVDVPNYKYVLAPLQKHPMPLQAHHTGIADCREEAAH